MAEKAIRFRFEYEGHRVRLVSSQKVSMPVPPSDEFGPGPHSGFWYELRDSADRVLYRKGAHSPIRTEHEAHDPDAGSPTRVRRHAPTGVFWLTTPDRPDARYLVLHSSPLDGAGRRQAAEELARFELEETA